MKAWFLGLLCAIALTACGASIPDLESQVKQSMNEKFGSDSDLAQYHLQVLNVTLVHAKGNDYEGVADVDYKGQTHDVPVHVVSDGSQMLWQVQQGGFGFLAQDIFQNAMKQSEKEINDAMQQTQQPPTTPTLRSEPGAQTSEPASAPASDAQ